MIRTLLLVIFFLLCLSGCGTTATEVRTVLITVPESMTQPVPSEEPPRLSEYLREDWSRKEEIWANKFRQQSLNVKNANERLKAIPIWSKQQEALIQSNNSQ